MPGEPIAVSGHLPLLSTVCEELVINALEATEQNGGAVSIELCVDGSEAVVYIRDDGVGVPEELQGRVCEPFFTTKDQSRHAGLGLVIAERFVDLLDGKLVIWPSVVGTTVEIRLPRIIPPPCPGEP
jgi:signal transduction histidine kinase